jgi:hypothetical protein
MTFQLFLAKWIANSLPTPDAPVIITLFNTYLFWFLFHKYDPFGRSLIYNL